MIRLVFTATKTRAVRVDQLLTQVELAKRAGITVATLSRLERGDQRPHFSTLRKVAKALGVKATDLIDRPNGVEVAAD
jgi:transcriptional regulator with XRE-family HTH domain